MQRLARSYLDASARSSSTLQSYVNACTLLNDCEAADDQSERALGVLSTCEQRLRELTNVLDRLRSYVRGMARCANGCPGGDAVKRQFACDLAAKRDALERLSVARGDADGGGGGGGGNGNGARDGRVVLVSAWSECPWVDRELLDMACAAEACHGARGAAPPLAAAPPAAAAAASQRTHSSALSYLLS